MEIKKNICKGDLLREVDRLSRISIRPRIALVGDICLDEYILGSCERLSPEAPVPVVHVNKREYRLGMTANVAYNILTLGGECGLFSVLGQDLVGRRLQQLLKDQDIDTEHLLSLKERTTSIKSRVLVQQHHMIRLDEEQRDPLSTEARNTLKERIKEQLKDCHLLILQDYAKGLFSEDLIQFLIKESHEQGKKVLADPNPHTPLSFYRGVHFFKPNLKEAYHLSSKPFSSNPSQEALRSLSLEIQSKIGPQSHILITQGAKGMSLLTPEGAFSLFPTQAQKVYDVTGAGDTVTACLGLFSALGSALEISCQLANFVAGQTLSQIGCTACSLSELKKSLSQAKWEPALF